MEHSINSLTNQLFMVTENEGEREGEEDMPSVTNLTQLYQVSSLDFPALLVVVVVEV